MKRLSTILFIFLLTCQPLTESAHAQILSGFFKSKIERAIDRGLRADGDLAKELSSIKDETASSAKDAAAILKVMKSLPVDQDLAHSKLEVESVIVKLMKQASPEGEGFRDIVVDGNIELLRIYRKFDQEIVEPDEQQTAVMLDALLTLTMFNSQEGTEAVIQAIRKSFAPQKYQWYSIMNWYAHSHRHSDLFFKTFHESLPSESYWDDLLSAANQAALADRLPIHPFDSQAGVTALQEMLKGPAAVNAAVAIAFLRQEHRDQLEELVLKHEDKRVKLEAAWAYAKAGSEDGFKRLVEYTLDVSMSDDAKSYLEELGKGELIPEKANEPEFAAKATMSNWLAHPNELGKSPEELLVVDHRELDWPGLEQPQHFWLLRYHMKTEDPLQPIDSGVGLVGSMTWCFFSDSFDRLAPEDVYAIHCVWEAENQDMVRVFESVPEKDKAELLKEWKGPELTEAEFLGQLKFKKEFGYPRKRVGLIKAKVEQKPGFAIVDGDASRWYAEDRFPPEFYDKYVAFIHAGRIRLGLGHWEDRRPLDSPTPALPPAEFVRIYEELLEQLDSGSTEVSAKLLDSASPIARHVEEYAKAKESLSQESVSNVVEQTYLKVINAYIRYLDIPANKPFTYPIALSMYSNYAEAIEALNSPESTERFVSLLPSLQRIEVWPSALGLTCAKLGLEAQAKQSLEAAFATEKDDLELQAMIELARIWSREGRQLESHAMLKARAESLVQALKKERMDVLRKRHAEEYELLKKAYLELQGELASFPSMPQ